MMFSFTQEVFAFVLLEDFDIFLTHLFAFGFFFFKKILIIFLCFFSESLFVFLIKFIIQNFCILQVISFSLKFAGTVFFSLSFYLASTSITSSNIITELSITFAKYLPFLQVHIAGF